MLTRIKYYLDHLTSWLEELLVLVIIELKLRAKFPHSTILIDLRFFIVPLIMHSVHISESVPLLLLLVCDLIRGGIGTYIIYLPLYTNSIEAVAFQLKPQIITNRRNWCPLYWIVIIIIRMGLPFLSLFSLYSDPSPMRSILFYVTYWGPMAATSDIPSSRAKE